MIIREELENGLVRHYSNVGMKILQIETGDIYDEAIDVSPVRYSYEETDEPIDEDSGEEPTVEDYENALERLGVNISDEG